MDYFKWLGAGLLGAAVGGAIWIAVGYYGNMEVGWIAWGIGFLAGMGVRAAAGHAEGYGPGGAAVIAAVFVVLISKYFVVNLSVDAMLDKFVADQSAPTEETSIALIADEIVEEYEEQKKPVNWPAGMSLEEATAQADYPPEIWATAAKRWQALTPEEQQQSRDKRLEAMHSAAAALRAQLKQAAFKESFAAWDLLWFALAAWTSFKIGSGMASENS